MQKADHNFIENLKKNGCRGDLEKIEISQFVQPEDLDIFNCEFIGVNKFYGKTKLKNSTIKDSVFFGHNYIYDSIVLSSNIGAYTMVENFSTVKNSTTSALTIGQNESAQTFPVLINNSQVNDDVILGGTDLCKTKSRGQSIFAFAHVGGGEFVRSTVLGTPPTQEAKNSLVEVGHFGYYGDLTVLSLAIKDKAGRYMTPSSKTFYENLSNALQSAYFGKQLDGKFRIVRGRSNFGAGCAVSNYDPIKGTKAGAFFMLSSCGANVSISPYLSVLPGSLIATGSVDITRERNIIVPNSLVIGARAKSMVLENYFDDIQNKIMNDRSKQEVEYLVQSLKIIEVLARFFAAGTKSLDVSQAMAFAKAFLDTVDAAKKLVKKTLPKYLTLLEKSASAIEQKIKTEPQKSQKHSEKLSIQKAVIAKSETFLADAKEIVKRIEAMPENANVCEVEDFQEKKELLALTKGQSDQLDASLINIDDL